jgi:hypothetical protein
MAPMILNRSGSSRIEVLSPGSDAAFAKPFTPAFRGVMASANAMSSG